MGFESLFHSLNLTLQVFFLDVLLSGDNAVVIALACRNLPAAQMRRAMLMGTGGAIGMRVVLTSMVSMLLRIPLLKIVGALALVVIAIKLMLDDDEDTTSEGMTAEHDLWAAVSTILVADVVMSLDNVIGLAAIAQGSLLFLVLGLLLSVPLLMFGSMVVVRLLAQYPLLIQAGGAMLGWFAGALAVSDPLVADWIHQQSPALRLVVPLLTACFVLVESRIIAAGRATALAIKPSTAARPKPPAPQPVTAGDTAPLAMMTTAALKPSRVERVPESASSVVEPSPVLPAALAAATAPEPEDSRSGWFALLGVSALVVVAVTYLLTHLTPEPTGLNRYRCPGDTDLFFRHGANTISMRSSQGSLTGVMHYDQLDWGDAKAAIKALGFPPPTQVRAINQKTVRIDGGRFVAIDCVAP
jgi:YjbE family integral membrane protein